MPDLQDIRAIRLTLASPEQIRAWSYGEVTTPDTLNYQSLKPEAGGLFCERIFGPTENWTCACGQYTRIRLPGVICDKCGVEVAPRTVRRERLGHIELAAPVAHTWYARGAPSRIGLLLDIPPSKLNLILGYSYYVVTAIDEEERTLELLRIAESLAQIEEGKCVEDGEELHAELREHQHRVEKLHIGGFLEVEEARNLEIACHFSVFTLSTGAEALRDLLASIDMEALAEELRETIRTGEKGARKKAIKRLKIVEAFRQSQVPPTWMILSVLPVLPPELRPMVPLEGGRFATTDLNDMYTRIINRNNRIKRLIKIGAPTIIINNEKRLLQDACDALFDNKRRKHPLLGSRNRPLKSLSDTLSSKKGRLRRNLLGKRVDFSGRSVISVGLTLKLHQCGLPKKIALELYKPFVLGKILDRNLAGSPKQAKRLIERKDAVVWDLLEECMEGTCVLLNRAPTLHRLSIQAFEPVLVEGGAIRLHPLVCSAFNADFDGDQMAVHLPLSDEAQREARELLLSTRNLRSPATGEPSISISQEMVLGCFYLTQERPNKKGEGRLFTDETEAMIAYEQGVVDLQAKITVRISSEQVSDDPPPASPRKVRPGSRVETTVGRILFNEVLPPSLRFKNYPMKKENLKQIVAECLNTCGPETTAEVADAIKRLGFHHATKSGISVSILSDITVPPERTTILAEAEASVEEIAQQFHEGMITEMERYQRVIDVWNDATERISKCLEDILDPYGNIYTIAKSGATKAKFQQIRQLSGMRGLMASPSGKIIEVPIKGNYLLGLTVAEYMIGSHGARKGAMDRSLNTANSGYRTRILVVVGHQVSIAVHDCGTHDGILITQEECRKIGLPDMRSRIVSRALAEATGGMQAGTLLTENRVDDLLHLGIDAVRVRSPLTCQSPRGICRMCYGLDLSTGELVLKGSAVGIIAAQSIGEPGTQLTMRTFHSGGIAGAQGDITQGQPRINELFEARVPKQAAVIAQIDGMAKVELDAETNEQLVRIVSGEHSIDDYLLPAKSTLFVAEGEWIEPGQIIARAGGLGQTSAKNAGTAHIISDTHITVSMDTREERLHRIPVGRKLLIDDGQRITVGSPLTAGSISPHDILFCAGPLAAQLYLVKEVQQVYRTTGVYLHDKHSEVIIRQMMRHIIIDDAGDTLLIPGTLVDRFVFTQINAGVLSQGGAPATGHPILLGTIKVALNADSWIAASSFQETTRVLADAAIAGKTDYIEGLIEHIVIGKKIPVGVTDKGHRAGVSDPQGAQFSHAS